MKLIRKPNIMDRMSRYLTETFDRDKTNSYDYEFLDMTVQELNEFWKTICKPFVLGAHSGHQTFKTFDTFLEEVKHGSVDYMGITLRISDGP